MKDKHLFADHLLRWFYENKREMPWRETDDPYKIWLSEVMLQQTQVNTVRPYYLRFIERFPDIKTLAETPVEEVVKYWEGLGYYSRVRNFHTAVKEVHEQYNSEVPDNGDVFLKLKGVGPYTRGAVMSIAFNKKYPAVDGNVYRVFSRLDDDAFDISSPKAGKHFEQKVMEVIPDAAGDFNEALMELGALVCTPKSPLCMFCPVMEHCESYAAGTVSGRPVKTKKVKKTKASYKVVIIEFDGKIIIEQRPDTGLLQSMWQFPMFEIDTHDSTIEEMMDLSLFIEPEPFMTTKHIFTHIDWHLEVYRGFTQEVPSKPYVLIPMDQKSLYNFPVSMSRIYDKYMQMR